MNNEQITSNLTRELELIRERYLKLVENHGELQKQNSLLEDRILSIVENYSEEKSQFEHDLLDAKQQIFDLKNTINELEIDKQRYKDDCNLAVRLLHQHPNEFISDQLINEFPSTNQSQHTVIVPTFPPTFTTSFPLFNTSSSINQTIATVNNDNLHLAESLYKSNNVHRYPSTYFICSNCHKTIKYSDVSVQTSLDDLRRRVVSFTDSDDGNLHNHSHMTVKEYQQGHTRRSSHDSTLISNSIPQMHHV